MKSERPSKFACCHVEISLPAFLGNDLQDPSPLAWMYLLKISSSSAVHLPLFNPTFSQQGALPILERERRFVSVCSLYASLKCVVGMFGEMKITASAEQTRGWYRKMSGKKVSHVCRSDSAIVAHRTSMSTSGLQFPTLMPLLMWTLLFLLVKSVPQTSLEYHWKEELLQEHQLVPAPNRGD